MPARFPVECLLPYEGTAREVVLILPSFGPADFKPNPVYGGRRILFLDSEQAQKEALAKNAGGDRIVVVPPDVVSEDEQATLERLIDRRLMAWGLVAEDAIAPALSVPETAGLQPEMQPQSAISATGAAETLARQQGVDLPDVKGTGRGGQITKADVQEFIDAR